MCYLEMLNKSRKTTVQPSVPCYGMSTPTNNWAYRHLEFILRLHSAHTIQFEVQHKVKFMSCKGP